LVYGQITEKDFLSTSAGQPGTGPVSFPLFADRQTLENMTRAVQFGQITSAQISDPTTLNASAGGPAPLDFVDRLRGPLVSGQVTGSDFGLEFYTRGITYVGRENGSTTVPNWSNSAVAKTINTVTNLYGSSGYYQIRPSGLADASIFEAIGEPNNLGATASPNPTLYSAPSFATVSGYAGTFVNFSGYPTFKGINGTTDYRQGALSISLSNTAVNPTGLPAGTYNYKEAFKVVQTQPAEFLLGIVVNAVGDAAYAPSYVSAFSSATGTVFSSVINVAVNTIRMPLFRITSLANDEVTIGLWRNASSVPAPSVAPFSLITFDRIR
jgi:hypothetical protein